MSFQNNRIGEIMKIAGQVRTPEEAKEIEDIARLFILESRIKQLVFKEEDTIIEKRIVIEIPKRQFGKTIYKK